MMVSWHGPWSNTTVAETNDGSDKPLLSALYNKTTISEFKIL